MPVTFIGGQQEPVDRLGKTRRAHLACHVKRRRELVRCRRIRREDGRCCGHPCKGARRPHIFAALSRNELSTTERDEALMAKAAQIGPIRMPKNGNRMPAAIGTPDAL